MPFTITQQSDVRQVRVEWVPEAMGLKRISIKYNGAGVICRQDEDASGSPTVGSFSVFVLAAKASAPHCRAVDVPPAEVTAGQVAQFKIVAYDCLDRPAVRGTELFRPKIALIRASARRRMPIASTPAAPAPGAAAGSSAAVSASPRTPAAPWPPSPRTPAAMSGRSAEWSAWSVGGSVRSEGGSLCPAVSDPSLSGRIAYDGRNGSANRFTVYIEPTIAGLYRGDIFLGREKVFEPISRALQWFNGKLLTISEACR